MGSTFSTCPKVTEANMCCHKEDNTSLSAQGSSPFSKWPRSSMTLTFSAWRVIFGHENNCRRWSFFRLVPLRLQTCTVKTRAGECQNGSNIWKSILKIVSSSFKMIAMIMCSLIHWAQNWKNEIVRLVVHLKDAWATMLAAHNVITCIDGLCSNSILYSGFDQYILVSFLFTLSPSEKCSVFVEMAFSFRGKNHSLLSRKCKVDCVAYGAREVVTPWYRLSKYQNCFSGVFFFSR